MKNLKIISLLLLFLLLSCTSQPIVNESKDVEKEPVLKEEIVKYSLSPETIAYAEKYCGRIINYTYKASTIEQVKTTETEINYSKSFEKVNLTTTGINSKYIKEIIERLPLDGVDDSVDILIKVDKDDYYVTLGPVNVEEIDKNAQVILVTDKDTMIELHNSVDVCKVLKDFTEDESKIYVDTSLGITDYFKLGNLKNCFSL